MAELSYSIVVPTNDDFDSLAEMKDYAFSEKRGCGSREEAMQGIKECYEKYANQYPGKLQHCRVAKDNETNAVLGGIQLQMPGDPGDLSFDGMMRHELQHGEAYIEWIATHPEHTGKGIGSKLLAWAFEYCAQPEAKVDKLSLEVMEENEGAIRLYERKGFVVKRDPHQDECGELLSPLIVFCCFGCKYCGVQYMEKPIVATAFVSPTKDEEMKRD
eukprot:Nitzschia sp. Nitz4//scaffold5_size260463//196074//196721//NITZ4_001009-RA/size260463-processed-gene-0.92-mRNA-1//1//CDS//3329555421//2511//frame0